MAGKVPNPATVSLSDLEEYRKDLNAITREGISEFKERIKERIRSYGSAKDWDDDIKSAVRDEVADLMTEYVENYGDATAARASRMFEDVLEAQGVSDNLNIGQESKLATRAQASSRQWARHLFGDEPDVDGFLEGCSSFVERNISHSADNAILEGTTGKKYRNKLRYARVPSGPSCGFCIMLASRGFVYATPESAGEFAQWHSHCDCRVVAGYKGLSVEGYDYEGMYTRYRMCRAALGSPEDIWEDFQALSQEERDSYGRGKRVKNRGLSEETLNKIGHQADSFNDYYAHRITAEMDLRDRKWLYDGTQPIIVKGKNIDPKQKELSAARVLSKKHGFKIEFRATRASKCKRTSDFFFMSGREDAPIKTEWELKQPIGSGKNNIFNQFNEASGQSERLIIDASMSPFSFNEVCKKARSGLKRRRDFTEVIVISGEEIRHYKK